MLDNRKALPIGTLLNFQGNTYELGEEIGRGSNALVYRGSYRDSSEHEQLHHVLIKELFPLHAKGKIFRNTDGSICVGAEAQSDFQMHKRSFEAGTKYHMALVEKYPDLFGPNLNNYAMNGTLYSILGVSGGESLAKIQKASTRKLRICVNRILALLDALEIFHANGLAHLDIAPDNIILLGNRNRERVILIDYNSTMSVDRNRPRGAAVFSIKQGYTAPEVHLGRIREIGTATDMYSVTAVFYWMMTGTILTNYQMIRPTPPDVSECVCIKDEPETVKAWVQEILRRGLQSRPARRYQSTEQMRRDLEELLDRIDGFGITHWALWEAGRKQVERMTRENPSLMHIRNSAKLFPSMAADDKGICPTEESIRNAQGSLMLLAGGGMGKTTSLLHLVLSDRPRYSPDRPAIMYLSLYGWQAGDNSYIVHSILDRLHYRKETHTYEDAGKELLEVLDHPIGRSKGKTPVLLLLLDGLNEVTGDPKPLLDEINRFSSMRGVRVVVASRTGEDTLPFPKLCLTELPDDIVREALSNEGLLLPENPDMQELLRTPMMLSMYIQAGKMEQKQVRVNSSEELLKAYLSALKEKAVRDLPEQTERRWQIDAAIDLVLPAIASEIQKKQRGLNNRELLSVVERCYRILGGKLSGRFFPQWIGRTAAIRGTAKTAEEWYGQIIHGILWKQLGLIVRDEQGPILNGEQEKYVVSHQVIEEYLLSRDKENLQKIKRYRRIKTLMVCICCCAVIAFSGAVYKTFIAPQPYEEIYADNVMDRALSAYVSAGEQYEMLSDLTECAMNTPESFEGQWFLFENGLQYKGMDIDRSLQDLTHMLETGEVMPWSNRPMDKDACEKLLTLSAGREEEYRLYSSVLEFVMQNNSANRKYGQEYPALLNKVLENDADIAAALYTIVCTPHLTGKYADHSITDVSYDKAYSYVYKQNLHINNVNPDKPQESLTTFEGGKNHLILELKKCGAFEAYQKMKGDKD